MSGSRQKHCVDTRIVLARPMSGFDKSEKSPHEDARSASFVPSTAASASDSVEGNIISEVASNMNNMLPKDPLGAKIEALRKEQQDMKERKKRLQKKLVNAERKKKRLCQRARLLSDKDLVAVLMMRKNQREGRGGPAAEDETGALRPADAATTASSTDFAV